MGHHGGCRISALPVKLRGIRPVKDCRNLLVPGRALAQLRVKRLIGLPGVILAQNHPVHNVEGHGEEVV